MRNYATRDIRNVGIVGHSHCGKTSVVAGLLYAAGATSRLTRVDEGNTVTDCDEEEIARKLTISSALAALEWKNTKINILDTPGFNLFVNDTRATLIAADAAIVVVDATSGVEPLTEKMWNIAEEYRLPRAIVINKLDRERASFERSMASIHARFGRSAIPIQLPIGNEKEFCGVVDLIRMKAFLYAPTATVSRSRRPSPPNMPSPQRLPTKNSSSRSPRAKMI